MKFIPLRARCSSQHVVFDIITGRAHCVHCGRNIFIPDHLRADIDI